MHPFRLKPAPAPAPTPAEVWPRPAAVVEPEPAARKPAALAPHTAIEIGWTRGPLDARRHLEDRVRDALTAAGLPVRRAA